jgi:hypothetical protein
MTESILCVGESLFPPISSNREIAKDQLCKREEGNEKGELSKNQEFRS